MVEKKSAKRKTFVTREDLINRLSEIAKIKGRSLYETVNEIFEIALTSEELGLTLKGVIEERHLIETAKQSGFILGFENLWYELADLSFEAKKRQALKSWFDTGVWFAKRYMTSSVLDPVAEFSHDLSLFTWSAPEFRIDRSKIDISITVISPRFSVSYTNLFASFLEGALQTFGYKIVSNDVKQGAIRLNGVKEEGATLG
ncbi:MAG: hypothetical protein GX638_04830 [Crenarchaeota archaeon]|nr:hypothetical protein [Thermoproteota archaeon]